MLIKWLTLQKALEMVYTPRKNIGYFISVNYSDPLINKPGFRTLNKPKASLATYKSAWNEFRLNVQKLKINIENKNMFMIVWWRPSNSLSNRYFDGRDNITDVWTTFSVLSDPILLDRMFQYSFIYLAEIKKPDMLAEAWGYSLL